MKRSMKKIISVGILAVFTVLLAAMLCGMTAFAAEQDTSAPETAAAEAQADENQATEETSDSTTGKKAFAAAICVGVVASAAAIGMAVSISKSADGISRQPEAAGNIRTSLMLGLVFIETAIIYALIIAILIIFVL